MADSKIRLSIGSVFHGEGLTKAAGAVDHLGKGVKKATTSLGQLGGAFGQLNGAVGKAAGAVGDLVQSLAGGPITIAITSISAIVGAFSSWKAKVEETKQKAAELRAEMIDNFYTKLLDNIDKAREKQIAFFDVIINKGQKAVERLTEIQAAMTRWKGSKGGLANAQFAQQMANIDNEGERRKAGAKDDFERQLIDQESKQKKLSIKRNQADSEYNTSKDALNREKAVIEAKIKAVEDTIKAEKAQASAIDEQTLLKKSSANGEKAFQLRKHMAKLQQERPNGYEGMMKKAQQELAKLAEDDKKMEEDYNKSKSKRNSKIEDLENKRAALITDLYTNQNKQKTEDTKHATKKIELDTEERAIQNETNKIKQSQKKAQEEADKQAKAKTKAERDQKLKDKADQAIKNEEQIAKGKVADANRMIEELKAQMKQFDERQNAGMNADHERHNGVFGQYKYSLDKNGNISSVTDALRAERYAKSGTEEEKKAENRRKADDKKAEMLSKKKNLTASEKKWLDKYGEMREREKADEELKQLEERKSKAILDMKTAVDQIKTDLAEALKAK